jgi:phytoene desaturase
MSEPHRVSGPSDHVVIVGAGLGGLSCALYLAGAGRRVTILERAPIPGGRAGRLSMSGFLFDTGPTVLTMPELIADALAAVDEDLADWLTLTPLDPAYRAFYADGSQLDVIAEPQRMAEEVARVCGPREADGYRRFAAYAQRLWQLERDDFIARNFDSPHDLLTANLLRLVMAGAFGRLQKRVNHFLRDERTRRVFSFQSMYAGLAPQKALAIYAVIAYLDTVAGVYYPAGGMHSLPQAMASAAVKHGVEIHYGATVSRVEVRSGRAEAVHTADGRRIPADVVVLNPDTRAAWDLLPGNAPRRRTRYSPSCVVLHIGSRAAYGHSAHHNIHFGQAWRTTFDEIIRQGRLMSDPSLLVTNPTYTDSTVAPEGMQSYYVLAPVPNLDVDPLDWRGGLADRYAGEVTAVLEQRGYPGFADATTVRHVVSPADWQDDGMAAGTPFAAAHTLMQTGPFRAPNMHPGLANVVFAGSGTTPGVGVPMVLISGKLAAERITGGSR